MTVSIQLKRGTKASLDSLASLGQLNAGEPVYITDLKKLAICTSSSTYAVIVSDSSTTPYLFEDSSYAVLGATNGVVLASGNISAVSGKVIVDATSTRPFSDNSISIGSATNRWTSVYASNGTIQTSDAREKQDISELNEAEKRVSLKLRSLIRKFRFKNAVELKGDAARIHTGIIAQDVVSAFESEGLDATKYGILCYDAWPEKLDENSNIVQEQGNRYGIRYDELFAFILASM